MKREATAEKVTNIHGFWKTRAFLVGILIMLLTLLPVADNMAEASEQTVITVSMNMVPLEIRCSVTVVVRSNTDFQLKTTIINHADTHITRVSAFITTPNEEIAIKGKREKNIGTLPPDGEKSCTWTLRALDNGEYFITITGAGLYSSSLVTAERIVPIKVTSESSVNTVSSWQYLLVDYLDALVAKLVSIFQK